MKTADLIKEFRVNVEGVRYRESDYSGDAFYWEGDAVGLSLLINVYDAKAGEYRQTEIDILKEMSPEAASELRYALTHALGATISDTLEVA